MEVKYKTRTVVDFPDQRIPESKKTVRFDEDSLNATIKECMEHDISRKDIIKAFNAVRGIIDVEEYKHVTNPYNSDDPKLSKFPAKLTNHDIINDVYRRYVGEYLSKPHEMVVTATDSDFTNRKQQSIDSEIDMELDKMLNNEIVAQLDMDEQLKVPVTEGDFGSFVDHKTANYKDSKSIRGQHYLNALMSDSKAHELYAKAFSDYITCGRYISYRRIDHDDVDKEIVPVEEYFRGPSNKQFIEDDASGCRLQYLTLSQIDAKFGKRLKKKDRDYLKEAVLVSGKSQMHVPMALVKSKYDGSQYPTFYDTNGATDEGTYIKFSDSATHIPVYHAFWTTEKEIAILTYNDKFGIEQEMIVESTYKLNPEIGDISLDKDYILAIKEGYRIGELDSGVYLDIDYLPVQRNDMNDHNEVKAPYNGITNLFGTYHFSIGGIMAPYQADYNIFHYHRSRIISRSDGKLLIMPEGLMAEGSQFSTDEKLYYAKADGKLYIDDTNPNIANLIQAIKAVDLSDYDLIATLTNILSSIKEEGREAVDMNRQRYGDIMTSAGKGTTDQAIVKSSVGTYPITFLFERAKERDFMSDLDHSRVAWRKGKKGSYITSDYDRVAFEVDPEDHAATSYITQVKSSDEEESNIRAFRELAFSAGQNGEFAVAAKAIKSKSSSQLETLLVAYQEKLDARQSAQQESAERIAQAAQQFEAQTHMADNELQKYGYDREYAKAIQVKLLDIQGRMSEGEDVTSDIENVTAELDSKWKAQKAAEYQKQRDRSKETLVRDKMANDAHIAKINKN